MWPSAQYGVRAAKLADVSLAGVTITYNLHRTVGRVNV